MRYALSYQTLLAALALLTCGAAMAAEIVVQLPERPATPGEPYAVTLRLDPGEGAIPLAPDTESLQLPEGVRAEWGALVSQIVDGEVVYTQTLEITGDAIAEFELDGLAYRFVKTPDQPKLTGEKLAADDAPFTVSLRPVAVSVVRDWTPILIGGASIGGLLLVFVLLFWSTRRRGAEESAPGGTPAEQVQARLHQARQHRLDGDFYKLYQAFAEAAKILSAHVEDAPEPEPLQQRAQEVGYRNERPSDDDMDGITKDLERALARLKENG